MEADAMAVAQHSLAKIEAHEAQCAERWLSCRDTLKDMKVAVSGFRTQLWSAALLVITTLLGAVGYLTSVVIH